jgi:hypothetical protein
VVQVATISVYGFFVLALLSRQLLDPRQTAEQTLLKDALHAIDMYVPVPTLLQLLLYVGWLKVPLPDLLLLSPLVCCSSTSYETVALVPRVRRWLRCASTRWATTMTTSTRVKCSTTTCSYAYGWAH